MMWLKIQLKCAALLGENEYEVTFSNVIKLIRGLTFDIGQFLRLMYLKLEFARPRLKVGHPLSHLILATLQTPKTPKTAVKNQHHKG
jgi:hypothetical protein